MDQNSTGFPDIHDFQFNDPSLVSHLNQYPTTENGSKFAIDSPDLSFLDIPFTPPDPDPSIIIPLSTSSPEIDSLVDSRSLSPDGSLFVPSTGWSPEGQASSPSDDSESSDPVLKYISQILMEENLEDKPSMFYNTFALQATEQSLYDVLGEQQPHYPSSFNQPQPQPQLQLLVDLNTDSLASNSTFSNSSNDIYSYTGALTSTSSGTSDFVDSLFVDDIGEYNPSLSQIAPSAGYRFQSYSEQPSLQFPSEQFSVNPPETMTTFGHGLMTSSVNELLAQNMFSDAESILLFQKGLEEASKFLPTGNQLIIDSESYSLPKGQKDKINKVLIKEEKDERENSPAGSRGRKNHEREDAGLEEERRNKQSSVFVEEAELSDMFDKVLLYSGGSKCGPTVCTNEGQVQALHTGSRNNLEQNGQANGSDGGKSRARKANKKDTVDLRTLLILCAQAVATNDCRTANELLKQIRQHSSKTGDGSQRLAHYFANGLEARLAGSGTGNKNYFPRFAHKRTAASILKAYKVYLNASPFKKFALYFSNHMILNVAEKETTLHIVDFGILYGFQWPMLIQFLAEKFDGHPPKLRITGIEFPQPGFKPAERIDETGYRLAKYCERFNVPFEYNGIASQYWETIKFEDLKINSNEVVAVNCLYRFNHLLDETDEVNCSRDSVLNLIRKINPAIFVNSITNGLYNAPFFVTRFREAIFHYSSLFDMFDTTMGHESQERLLFEEEFYSRDAINAIACEGLERTERPESYKQWHSRTMRAGFKPLPVSQELMEKVRYKLKKFYHKDFVVDEDGNWMLQGWKGRILYASSSWIPA
ncbi:scarecrow-like protein 34 [Mangifera indica]|uniref:scarecrow-like protein 34 n=1 Tax=Mangifera indica TaxID=29780 RepID=UPI001CFB9E81|nr:scarecrow-like protein 34 [Mangifera indica]